MPKYQVKQWHVVTRNREVTVMAKNKEAAKLKLQTSNIAWVEKLFESVITAIETKK